ncbi:MAG: NADH-quinone oxidoreductase subunit NuoK [Thermoplasmata archaeon]|nr:NADH-quinone oxidoreductase subunit NuoK [Thermoplasmata archaeon]
MIPLTYYLVLSAMLFCIGIYGVLTKKNAIYVLMSIEIMLNAVNINFVAFSAYSGDVSGQVFALFSIGLAAAEVAIGLAIFLLLYKRYGTVELQKIRLLRW